MFEPQSYGVTLLLMLVSMLSWGSWANTMKLVPKWPFQLFYWDYALGVLLIALILGFTLGNVPGSPLAIMADFQDAGTEQWLWALGAGAIFNIANLLLVAAISIAGLAVAFPVGIGLALITGVLLNYALSPGGNPILLFGGVALVSAAIIVDALAFRRRDKDAPGATRRGLILSLLCGILMGSFYPLVVRATSGEHGFGPYAVAVVFAIGVLLCALPVNSLLMRRPITDEPPTRFSDYAAGSIGQHSAGLLGGAIWGLGCVASFVAAHAAMVGPAISYAMGQGATMVSAAWGVFVWREFATAPANARRLLAPMFLLFLIGLSCIAVAPLYAR